jgi:hypothetical protein
MFEKMNLNKDQMLSFDELKLGLHKIGHQMPDVDVQIIMEVVSNILIVDTVDEEEYETDMSGFVPLHNVECDSTGDDRRGRWK